MRKKEKFQREHEEVSVVIHSFYLGTRVIQLNYVHIGRDESNLLPTTGYT